MGFGSIAKGIGKAVGGLGKAVGKVADGILDAGKSLVGSFGKVFDFFGDVLGGLGPLGTIGLAATIPFAASYLAPAWAAQAQVSPVSAMGAGQIAGAFGQETLLGSDAPLPTSKPGAAGIVGNIAKTAAIGKVLLQDRGDKKTNVYQTTNDSVGTFVDLWGQPLAEAMEEDETGDYNKILEKAMDKENVPIQAVGLAEPTIPEEIFEDPQMEQEDMEDDDDAPVKKDKTKDMLLKIGKYASKAAKTYLGTGGDGSKQNPYAVDPAAFEEPMPIKQTEGSVARAIGAASGFWIPEGLDEGTAARLQTWAEQKRQQALAGWGTYYG